MQRYCTASSSGRQPDFAALNRGRHLCSAGRPSGWALAHILVYLEFADKNLIFAVLERWLLQLKEADSSFVLIIFAVFGRPFVKRFALRYRTVICPVCLSLLSVTLVYFGQTVGCIKMKLGTQVGLGPDHTVLNGNPAHPPKDNFRPISVVAKWLHGSRCPDSQW